MKMRYNSFIIFMMTCLCADNSVAEVYKCRNYDGDISYSEEPCAKNETEWGVKISPQYKKARKKESILSAIYSADIYESSVKALGRCSGFHFKYPDTFTKDDQALRTSAISALRKISGYYHMTEAEFTQMHNSSMLDTMDIELGKAETLMYKINCNKQFKQIMDYAKPERFVEPEN